MAWRRGRCCLFVGEKEQVSAVVAVLFSSLESDSDRGRACLLRVCRTEERGEGLSRPSGVVGGLGPFRPACLPQGYIFLFKFEFEIQSGVLNKRNFINQTKF